MTRWLVRLSGEAFDLEEYGRHFPDGDATFIEEDGHFYLVGPALDALPTAEQVHETAQRLLKAYSAVVAVLQPGLRPATLDAVIGQRDDGTRKLYTFGQASITLGAIRSTTAPRNAPPQPAQPTQAQRILAQRDDRPHYRTALDVWAETPRAWPRLYRILEVIERDLGQTVDKAGFCSRNERERFTRSAQHPHVAGIDARHPGKKYAPPPNPMTHAEAEAFIGRLLQWAAGQEHEPPPRL